MGNKGVDGGLVWTQRPAEIKMCESKTETEQIPPDLPEIVVGNIAKIL